MDNYKRKTNVAAIQFIEEEFHKNPLEFISVFDEAMVSELWHSKTAKDGRYYIMNQTNTFPFNSYTDVGEGDYIIHDEGHIYVMTSEAFERIYELVD